MLEQAQILEFLYKLSFTALPIIIAITLNEAAHGWAALKLGDDTADRLGRVAVGLLPDFIARPLARLERIGILLLLFLLVFLPYAAGQIGHVFDPVRWLLLPPTQEIIDLILRMTGLI